VARWSFADLGAAGFEAHAEAHLPGYRAGQEIAATLAGQCLTAPGLVYDLGCATGAIAGRIAEEHPDARVVAVDLEPCMVAAVRRDIPNLSAVVGDVRAVALEAGCDVVVAHYTLGFVPKGDRMGVLGAIRAALRPGGALVLFDKTLAPTSRAHEVLSAAYVDHKLARGVAPGELIDKQRSLRGVLEPWTEAETTAALAVAGFADVTLVHKHYLHAGWLAL
jgi:tRNA (cmo5U34)-methyltransferase